MKLQHYRLHSILCFLFLGSSILTFLLYFGAALSQEKDTPEILKTAMFMELTRTNVATVGDHQQRLLIRTFPSLKTYLEQYGWTWKDQMGAVVVYSKVKRRLNANCVMYSRSYMICNLNQVP